MSRLLFAARSVLVNYGLFRHTVNPPSRLRSAVLAVRVYRRGQR